MGVVGSVLRVCFGLTLAVFMLADWLFCRILLVCTCLGQRTRGGVALVATQLAYRMTLFLSPWVWVTAEPGNDEIWAEIQKQLDSDDPRPVFLLGNHTSFMDTLLTVGARRLVLSVCLCSTIAGAAESSKLPLSLPAAKMPARIVYRARTYMAQYLLDMPILGTVIRAMGHFEVPFQGKKDGDFSVDREKMAQIQLRVDEHIHSGGVLCFFPEGQLNTNPSEIMVHC